MPLTRDEQGRLRTPAEYDSPEFRAEMLLRHRAGGSARTLAAETGRAKSAIARDITQARQEEAEALDAEAEQAVQARAAAVSAVLPPPEPDARPAAKVWVGTPQGLVTSVRDADARDPGVRLLRREMSSDAQTAVRASRELDRLTMQANYNAGLSPSGMATVTTPLGRYVYDPREASEVSRIRSTICDDVLRATGDPDLAEEASRTWEPARLPR